MTAPLIGWGTVNGSGLPKDATYLSTNEGMVPDFFLDDYLFVGVDGAAPGAVAYTLVFQPALGGDPTEITQPDEGGGVLGIQFSVFDPGIMTITAVVDGMAAENELVGTITSTGGAYGTFSWFSQPATPPVSKFWTRFVNTREVI